MHFLRKILSLLFLSIFTGLVCFAQNFPQGYQLSQQVEAILTENGFYPDREYLRYTGRDKFPYNISLTLNDEVKTNLRNTVIVDILQQDFLKNKKEIISLIQSSRSQEVRIIYLFSTVDSNLPTEEAISSGSEYYAFSYQNKDNSCAVSVSFDESKNNYLNIGSTSTITPLWLARRMARSFESNEQSYSMDHIIMSLYRMGLVKGDRRLSAYINNTIPAIGLSLNSSASLKSLGLFLDTFSPEETYQWDNHYVCISLPFTSLWLGERFFAICLMIIIFVILFIIVFFSFVGKNKEINRNKLKKTWYMIPLTLTVSFCSLYVGQFFAWTVSKCGVSAPFILFGIKIIFSMLIISCLFAYQEHRKINMDEFVYGYILTVLSIVNIFVFSTVDLLLLFVFFVEYILVHISRATTTTKHLIISIILMILPFVPYIYVLLTTGDPQSLTDFSSSTFGINLLLTMGLFPFEIMWLRILVNLSVWQKEKNHDLKKRLISISLTTTILICIAISFFVVLSVVIKNKNPASQQFHYITSEEAQITVSSTKQKINGLANYQVSINSKEQPLRYKITVNSNTEVPIFDSLYDYKILNKGISTFLLPDYPPSKINLVFASEEESNLNLSVEAWYPGKDNWFRTEVVRKNIAGGR